MTYTVKVEYVVTPQKVADMMVTCFEGGSNYWLGGVQSYKISRPEGSTEEPWYADPNTWDNPFQILFYAADEDDDEEEPWFLDDIKLEDGLEFLLKTKPAVFHSIFVEDDYDAADADSALQIILLGDIVYG